MHLGGRRLCAEAFVAGLTMLVCVPAHARSAPEWPQYGFDARHSLFDPFEHTLDSSNVAGLSLQWEFMTGNGTGIAPFSGPALADGVLYVGSLRGDDLQGARRRDRLDSLDLHGSSALSRIRRSEADMSIPLRSTAISILPDELCRDLHARLGRRRLARWERIRRPTFSKGNLYIGGYDGRVYAFDAATGTELWSAQVNPMSFADPLNFAPAVSRDRVFVSGDRGVFAFPGSCTTPCAPLWVARTAILAGRGADRRRRLVLVADYQGTVYAMDAATGAVSGRAAVTAIPHAIATAHGSLM